MTLEELLRQGKSFGQGASNAAASTVTGPVDMLAWLLRKGGVNVGDAPMGGEAWMRQKGLMATPENRLAGLLGEGAGLAAPIVAAAKAPEIAGGLLQMGRNLATPQTLNKQTGAIVYHGSPHKFDKFDSSKIGTGEGAQAYGHGLYFAESPDVAKQYATGNQGRAAASDGLIDALPKPVQMDLYKAMNMRDGFVKDAMLEDIYKQYPQAKAVASAKDAKLYKVDLPDEHIAKMLDWDKPLLEQQSLLKSVPEFAEANQAVFGHPISTSEPLADMAYQTLSKHLGGADKAADLLRKRGIPGIRYLDGGSRGAATIYNVGSPKKGFGPYSPFTTLDDAKKQIELLKGHGFHDAEMRIQQQPQTSNFVVFPGNEGLLKILERNGGKP